MPASAGLLQRAAALLEGKAPERSRLLSDLGYALFEIGEFGRADAVVSEAQRLARALGDRAVECSAEVKRGNIRIYTDPPSTNLEELGDQARRAIDELTALGDDAGLSRAWTALSEVLYLAGRVVEAAEATQLAADHARRAGSRREEAWALGEYGFCLFEGPTPADAAISELQRVIGQAEGNPIMEANMHGFLALQEALAGRLDEARRRVTASLGLTRDLGLRWQTGIHNLLSAYVALLAGDPAAAEREMLDARAAFLAIGDGWFLSTISVDLPRPVYRQGRFGDAQALVDAIDEWPAPADLEWQIKRRGVRSLLLARDGRDEEALALATEAVELASEQRVRAPARRSPARPGRATRDRRPVAGGGDGGRGRAPDPRAEGERRRSDRGAGPDRPASASVSVAAVAAAPGERGPGAHATAAQCTSAQTKCSPRILVTVTSW